MHTEALKAMKDQGVVAVLRSSSVEQAIAVAKACAAGGVTIIEVTFSVPSAPQAITALVQEKDLTVGAGTVINAQQARDALAAGAAFLVGPNFSQAVADIAQQADVPYLPGCMTVTEMQNAYEAGCPAVKLFPSSEFSTGFIKAVHAPLPHLQIMPTGGVSLANAADWIAGGAFCVGVGGNLTKLVDGDTEAITRAAQGYIAAVKEGRGH